jgi:hypothetical protein
MSFIFLLWGAAVKLNIISNFVSATAGIKFNAASGPIG